MLRKNPRNPLPWWDRAVCVQLRCHKRCDTPVEFKIVSLRTTLLEDGSHSESCNPIYWKIGVRVGSMTGVLQGQGLPLPMHDPSVYMGWVVWAEVFFLAAKHGCKIFAVCRNFLYSYISSLSPLALGLCIKTWVLTKIQKYIGCNFFHTMQNQHFAAYQIKASVDSSFYPFSYQATRVMSYIAMEGLTKGMETGKTSREFIKTVCKSIPRGLT